MILLICLMVLIVLKTFKTTEFIIKKHETLTENSPIETMKLLGSTKKDVDKDKNGEDVPKLESVEVVLIHCNLVNNNYQPALKVLFTFVSNKQFGQLKYIAPHSLTIISTSKI